MRISALAASVAMTGALVGWGTCLPAQADDSTGPAFTVPKLERTSRWKATVKVDLTCPKGSAYDLSVEILQDRTPDVAPLDAYYTGTRPLHGRCTSKTVHLTVHARADRSGDFAPKDGWLRKGAADVVLGGSLDDEPVVLTATAKVR